MKKIDTPRLYYSLEECIKLLDKNNLSENDILHMAALGKATLHIWYKGTIMFKNFLKENIRSQEENNYSKKPYNGLAQLPIEEAAKFVREKSAHIRNLKDTAGNSFVAYWADDKEFNTFQRQDLCMVPEEVKRLDQEFSRLQKEQSVDQVKEPDNIISDSTKKLGGAPKSCLREAVEYTYNKLLIDSNLEPIKPRNIDQFIGELKKMKKSALVISACPAFDNIQEIKKSLGKWVIRTEDRVIIDTDKTEKIEKAKTYSTNAISKILTNLRKEKPLPK